MAINMAMRLLGAGIVWKDLQKRAWCSVLLRIGTVLNSVGDKVQMVFLPLRLRSGLQSDTFLPARGHEQKRGYSK